MLIRKSLSSLIFTQPLVGNYGVPSSARDENGLLKYFESPVRTLRENSQFVAERVLGHTMEAKAINADGVMCVEHSSRGCSCGRCCN